MLPEFWYVVCVVVFVLAFTVLLDRLLLRPVTRIMQARQAAVASAREMAETSRRRAQAAMDEFDAKMRAARADVYRLMDDNRRAAQGTRAELVAATRREVERSMGEAAARLQTQADAARRQLDSDADTLASTIVERVLGRKAS